MATGKPSIKMRVIHRYLGFFLAGIMGVYALSGVVMIFRNTDFLKQEKQVTRSLAPGLAGEELGRALRIKGFQTQRQEGDLIYFAQGSYHQVTGEAVYTEKKLPLLLDKMQQMHKATSDRPLFWVNIGFGLSLLFFVLSAFWMFRPKTSIFKKGLYFTAAGFILMVIMLWV